MTLIEELRAELKDILAGTVKEFRQDDCFKSITRKERVLSFINAVARPYSRALRILRTKLANSRKYLSDEKLINMLDEFIVDLKYDDGARAMREIDSRITKLFDSIRAVKTETQLFIIPIMRLSVSQDITIG